MVRYLISSTDHSNGDDVTAPMIELVEADAWSDMFAAAPAALAQRFGMATGRIGGHRLFAMRQSVSTLFNRALGSGVEGQGDIAALDAVLPWLAEHCAARWAVVLAPSAVSDALSAKLSARGLAVQTDGLMKFHRSAAPVVEQPRCAYDIRLVGEDRSADFGGTAEAAFGLDAGLGEMFSALCGRPHWRTYAAYDGDTPVGVGAAYVSGDFAWLGVGATLEGYRQRGVQSALLARRIHDAQALGAKTLTIETHRMGPTEAPTGSHRNVLRAGFTPAYFRQVFLGA